MLEWLKGLLRNRAKDGVNLTIFSTGKPFDPRYQVRTSATEDLLKQERRKRGDKRTDGVDV